LTGTYEYDDEARKLIETRFLESLRWHLAGWRQKVEHDFSKGAFTKEIQDLQSDAVYRDFGFARAEYVLVRLMGRMSISIGRRLGEMYDKLPRLVAAARFGLSPPDVVECFDGLELDVAIRRGLMSPTDQRHFDEVTQAWFSASAPTQSLAIEIRYNFNPNDSARLRKDIRMAELVRAAGFFPLYLVFSGISPRRDAIGRLTRAGWHFLVAAQATAFMRDLLNIDIMDILQRPAVQAELREEVDTLMRTIFTSFAFRQAATAYFS